MKVSARIRGLRSRSEKSAPSHGAWRDMRGDAVGSAPEPRAGQSRQILRGTSGEGAHVSSGLWSFVSSIVTTGAPYTGGAFTSTALLSPTFAASNGKPDMD